MGKKSIDLNYGVLGNMNLLGDVEVGEQFCICND